MKHLLILAVCALTACDDGAAEGVDGADGGGAGGGAGGAGGGSLAGCEALFDDCPIGTTPSLEASLVAQCAGEAGTELVDGEGAVSGVCQASRTCLLVCTFTSPCRCGVESITRAGVTCFDCGAQGCGNGLCEGTEDPVSCPADCGPQCEPAADGRPAEQRCDGEVRQVCEANGRWADLACRDDQICEPYAAADQLTFCQTRTNPAGGVFRGLGARNFTVTGRPADIRFGAPDLTCPDQRIGILRTVVEDTGSLVFIDGDPIVRMDLATRACSVLPPHGLVSPLDFAAGRAVAGGARQATLWEELSGRAYGTATFVDDYVPLAMGTVVLSPGGENVAAALTVAGRPAVAVWDAATGALEHLLGIDDAEVVGSAGEAARFLRFSANALHLFEVRGQHVITWDLETGRYVEALDFGVPVLRVATDPTGAPHLAVVTLAGLVVRDLEARRTVWQIPLANQGVAVDFSPDGEVVAVGTYTAVGGGTMVIALLRADDGRLIRNLDAGPYDRGWLEVLFMPDGRHLIVNHRVFADRFQP